MPKRKAREDQEQSHGESVAGVFMKIFGEVIDSEEWGEYEISVRCEGRKICRGFEVKKFSFTKGKVNTQEKQGG